MNREYERLADAYDADGQTCATAFSKAIDILVNRKIDIYVILLIMVEMSCLISQKLNINKGEFIRGIEISYDKMKNYEEQ